MMGHDTKNSNRWNDQAGLTLLELLVAMTLLSMLLVMLFTSLHLGTRAWQRNKSQNTGVDDVRVVQELLRQALRQAYPLFMTTDSLHPRIDFIGRSDSLEFLGPSIVALLDGGRARIIVQAIQQRELQKLVMSVKPELADGTVSSVENELLTDVQSIKYAYFGKMQKNDTPQWHDVWENKMEPPRLIRLHIQFPPGDTRFWPDLIVAPEILVDANCSYDSLTKYCRGR